MLQGVVKVKAIMVIPRLPRITKQLCIIYLTFKCSKISYLSCMKHNKQFPMDEPSEFIYLYPFRLSDAGLLFYGFRLLKLLLLSLLFYIYQAYYFLYFYKRTDMAKSNNGRFFFIRKKFSHTVVIFYCHSLMNEYIFILLFTHFF